MGENEIRDIVLFFNHIITFTFMVITSLILSGFHCFRPWGPGGQKPPPPFPADDLF